MPCQERSDELILLAHKHVDRKLAIIGCGGVFDAKDAYRKFRLGASLVQLVSGLVFCGPQLPAEICADLPSLLRKDGFAHLVDVIGRESSW